MKKYLIASLLLFSFFGFSQATPKNLGIMSKTKLGQVKMLSELIKEFPKKYKSVATEMSGIVKGKPVVANWNDNELSTQAKDIMRNSDVGTKIYMDMYFDDHKSKVRSYMITVAQ